MNQGQQLYPNSGMQRLRQQLDVYLARPWLYPDETKTVERLASRLGVKLSWETVRVDLWNGQPAD